MLQDSVPQQHSRVFPFIHVQYGSYDFQMELKQGYATLEIVIEEVEWSSLDLTERYGVSFSRMF